MRYLALALLLAVPALPAQQTLRNFASADLYQYFVPMNDLDGDGYEDMLTTSIINVSTGPFHNPYENDYEIRFHSGRDGSLLRLGPRWSYPDNVACYASGDHDHDGVRDYIALEADQANFVIKLSARSGLDDHAFWTLQSPLTTYWAFFVIGDLDLNGDGELDVVVGHPSGANSSGSFWAYDHTGTLLYSMLSSPFPNYTIVQSLAKLGDVNGDGCDDFITGLGDPTWRGGVAVISGQNGQVLRTVLGQNVGDYIGSGCTGCGDLDGDGLPDFAAGGGLSGSFGSVQAFSSATGAMLFATYSGYIGDRFGAALRAADYDHDGIDDIISAAWSGMWVVSGRDGTIIQHYIPNSTASWGTFEAQPLATPSGFPHLFVRTQVLGAHLMSAQPHLSEILGPGCSVATNSNTPQLGMRELQGDDGNDDGKIGRRVTLSGAGPGTIALLLLGLADSANGPVSLAPLGLPQCLIYPNIQIISGFTTGVQGISAGFARHDFIATNPSTVGLFVDAQWATLDANLGLSGVTEAIRFAVTH